MTKLQLLKDIDIVIEVAAKENEFFFHKHLTTYKWKHNSAAEW